MRSAPLLPLLLVSSASAFSPAALPRTRPPVAPRTVAVGVASHRHGGLARKRSSPLGMSTPQPSATAAAVAAVKKERQFTYKKRLATLMAFMTGWADYIFITKYNFFATMMTGNSMKMANALVRGSFVDASFFATVIASYIIGVGAFRRAELSYKDHALNGLFAPVVAGCFLWSDYLSWANPAAKFLPAILLSFSWGIINSVGSEVTGTLIFVVTGAMTRLSNFMVDRISRTAGRKKIPKEGMLMSLSVIGGFILGAAWSVFLSIRAPQLTTRGAFSIMGGIYGLLFLWLDRDVFGSWWSKKNGELCEIDADEVDCK